jgi:hypothetical protein
MKRREQSSYLKGRLAAALSAVPIFRGRYIEVARLSAGWDFLMTLPVNELSIFLKTHRH